MNTDYRVLTALRDYPRATNIQIAKMCASNPKRVRLLREKENRPEPITNVIGTYFITDGQGNVKIGHTDRDAYHRIMEMQTGNAFELKLLGVCDLNECELHVKFAHYHVRGEWFVLSDEIKEFIKNEMYN